MTVSKLRYVVDVETDALVNHTRMWCVVLKDIDTNEVHTFVKDQCFDGRLKDMLSRSTLLIGHNIIGFDYGVLEKYLGTATIMRSVVVDTLVLSRLFQQDIPNGHSLEAWGARLSYAKQAFDDFSEYSEKMLSYCVTDVHLCHKVFTALTERMKSNFDMASKVEHQVAFLCMDMSTNGFPFDKHAASKLYREIDQEVTNLDVDILQAFKPEAKFIRVVTPKLTANGTISKVGIRNWYDGDDYTIFSEGAQFSLVEWVPFNPASPSQVVKRLNKAGWSPTERTNGYLEALRERDAEKLERMDETAWKVNEANLSTLPDTAPPAAKLLVKRIMLNSRLTSLKTWFEEYRETTRCVHGTFNSIGTWTHRMSHVAPNMGNIAAKKSIKYKGKELNDLATNLGGRMRQLWRCAPSAVETSSDHNWLVGTDADGIQLRILAHYMQDERFTEALINGDSSKGTDAHSLNRRALGEDICKTRDTAKTFIYAWLLGAGIPKIADILGCTIQQASMAVQKFIKFYPGLERLKSEIIPRDAAQGFFVGLDGRPVFCSSRHLMLAGYLQNGEVCVMKHALVLWDKRARDQQIKFVLRNFVHDEWQTSVRGPYDLAVTLGTMQAKAIEETGVLLGTKCPLKGNFKVGKNWLDTH